MNRRDALQRLSGVLAIHALGSLPPSRLILVGRTLHDRVAPRNQHVRQILDDHQNETVATIAEHIIPETDTPGARAVRVNDFVDLLLAEWCDDEERDRFLRGLAEVDSRSVNLFDKVFVEATFDQQITLLSELDAEALDEEHFFAKMKWFTLYGYYTSEIGQTEELQATIIPGRYDPCGPVNRDTPGVW